MGKIVAFRAQKIQTSSLRSQCTHNEWLFGADFDSGVIGPFFFENEQGAAVAVNGKRYRAMLNEFKLLLFVYDYVWLIKM